MHDSGKQPRYETRDVSARSMVWSGLGLVVLMVVGLAASWAVMKYFVAVQKLGPPASPFDQTRTLPPEPRLSVNPTGKLKKYEEKEREQLENYGWVDRNAGTVHIPIERAMELSLEKGFPVRPVSAAPQGGPARPPRSLEASAQNAPPGRQ